MYDDEREPPLITRTTAGSYYLKGFADGYHDRPQKNPRTKEAREAYMKGYSQGVKQRQAQTTRKEA